MQAIRYETEVNDEHCIHLSTPDLPQGTVVELIALIKQRPFTQKMDWSTRMGRYPRSHSPLLENLADVNRYVESLREDRE